VKDENATMKILLVARKYTLEFLRDPTLLALSLLTPLAFILITYVGYGNTPKLATYPVLVVDERQDAESAALLDALRARRYPDGRPTFALALSDESSSADASLKARDADALLVLSSADGGALHVTLRGDGTSMRFIAVSTLLEDALTPILVALTGTLRLVNLVETPSLATAPASEFDAYTPGMIIFAILMLIPQTAMLVGREMRTGTLRRLHISRLRMWELLAGVGLAQMLVAAVQMLAMVAAALALGFHNQGSLALALFIGLLLSFGAIGWGLVVACFVRTDSDALNVGSVVTMVQVFLSGAFFAMAAPPLFSVGGYVIGLFDLIPATHGMIALQQVMVGGAALPQVAFRLAMMAALSILTLAGGLIVFGRRAQRTFA
jgi:ABC-2 type transport system permease protein